MNILELPEELQINILKCTIPNNLCDIDNFKNYFLICKYWNIIFNSEIFWNFYANKLKIYSPSTKYKRQFFFNNFVIINDLVIIPTENTNYFLKNNKIDKNLLTEYHYFSSINICFDKLFITYLGYDFLKSLPVIYFNNTKCIQGLCSHECYNNHHNLSNYNIKSNIVRGIDSLNNPFLLVIYKNLTTNTIYYEFLYHKQIYNSKKKYICYNGIYNNCYIGMKSELWYNIANNEYRQVTKRSFNYLIRLINNEKCGYMKYDSYSDLFLESFDQQVSIYF